MRTGLEIIKELHKLSSIDNNEWNQYHALCCTLEVLEKRTWDAICFKKDSKITRNDMRDITQWVNRYQSCCFIVGLERAIDKIKKIQYLSEEEFEQ